MNANNDTGPIRIISNTEWFRQQTIAGHPIEAQRIPEMGAGGTLRALAAAGPFDVAVLNGNPQQLLVFCLWKLLNPFCRWRLVSLDLVLQRPRNFRQHPRTFLVRRLLRRVDRFLFFYKDTQAIETVYGIDHRKVQYVPFKINEYDDVVNHPTVDEGFILSCGRSKRDYATFCEAVDGLPYATFILAPAGRDTMKHGTTFNFRSLPENVRLITDDGSDESWAGWISKATCVVLPVLPDTLAASGISTYLAAMAMGKCVIITESPATLGLLDEGQAVVVPPADPAAMRAAVVEVFEDRQHREAVAAAGRDYALSLGDESRLARDVAVKVGQLLGIDATEENLRRDETAETCRDVAKT